MRTCVYASVRACVIVHKLTSAVQSTLQCDHRISNAYTQTQGRVPEFATRNSAPGVIHGAQSISMCLRERGGGGFWEGVERMCVCLCGTLGVTRQHQHLTYTFTHTLSQPLQWNTR